MPVLGPQPRDKIYFKFRPAERAASSLERMGADVFPDGFKILSHEYNKTGRKILVVSDRVSKHDVDRGEMFSGEEAGGYDNLLAYSLGKTDATIKQIATINWPFAWVKNDKNREEMNEAHGHYLERLRRFVNRWKPDAVVLCGVEMYEYIFTSLLGPSKFYRAEANILRRVDWGEHKTDVVGTLDVYRPISWDNKYTKDFPHLLGYISRAFITAFNGKNRFHARMPDKRNIRFEYVDTIDKFKKLHKRLMANPPVVSIDTEGASLARAHNTLFSVQIAMEGDRAYFVPLDHPQTPFTPKELRQIKRGLREYFENGTSKYHIYQNAKHDLDQWYGCIGLRFYNHRVYDVQAGEYTLDENRKLLFKVLRMKPYSLDFIAEQRGCTVYRSTGFTKGDRANVGEHALPPPNASAKDIRDTGLVEYGCYDVLVPWHIVEAQRSEAKAVGNKRFLTFVCEQLSDTQHAFAQMEFSGTKVDKRHLFKLKSSDGPIGMAMREHAAKFRDSKACRQVNAYLLKKKGVPEGGGLWGNSTWLFDIDKPQHQQLLFFHALKLQPLGARKDGGGQINKAFQEKYKDVPEVASFNQYQRLKTLRDNFVNGIYTRMARDPDALADSRIRARYGYTDVVTSRTCLDGSTPIYVLDKRGQVPLKKIKAGDWVWAFNKKLRPVAVQVEWQGRTKFTETVTVTYQPDVGSYKTIICTPCHRFRLRDGTYRRADQLKNGDRILALERKYSKAGYRYLLYTGMKNGERKGSHSRIWEHKLAVGCPADLVAHHVNEIKDDNVPTNLQVMTQAAHAELHGYSMSDTTRRKIGKSLRKQYKTGQRTPPGLGKFGADGFNYKPLDKDWALKVLIENKGSPTAFVKQHGWDYATVTRKLTEHNINWRAIKARFNGEGKYITDKMLKRASEMNSLVKAHRYLHVSYYKAQELLASDRNHSIIKVERNKGKRWTYDLTIPEHHNFIANGLCVHNSAKDPNLQNIPNRGPLAKLIKRLFIAEQGCLIVKNDYSAHEVRDWANEAHDEQLAASFYAGLKYRQELRLIAYRYPEQAEAWTAHKEKHNWFGIKEYDKKIVVIDAVKDKIARAIGKAELELEVKGDVHKLNCEIFYKVPVLEVTDDQRQDIKALVFGTIYGKTAGGLAVTLNKTEEYAQGLQDMLFEKFPVAAKWLRQIEKQGQKNLFVESPLGMLRHLWGYMHNRKGVVNAMNRRGPNSIIQGVASCIGISSIRIMQKLIWHYFIKHDVPFQWRSAINYVHDSVESETSYALVPIYLYLIEHASTTLIHRRYRKLFDYDLTVGLELEFQMGASIDRVGKWNFMADSLFAKMEGEMKWQKEELGYKPDFKQIDIARKNWGIIADLRRRELKEAVQTKKPSEIMLMTPENARSLGLRIPG
jgi:DNA polymerase I-like protein with 3'-5' exonuclease and polymerase domains